MFGSFFSIFHHDPEIVEIVDDPNILTSSLIKSLRDNFPVEIVDEDLPLLDKSLPPPKKQTTRKFYLSESPNKALGGLSTNKILRSGLPVMSMRERLEFERIWFERFKTHPDSKRTATLCAGSPVPPYNNAAMIFWNNNKLSIQWCCPNSQDKYLRARVAL